MKKIIFFAVLAAAVLQPVAAKSHKQDTLFRKSYMVFIGDETERADVDTMNARLGRVMQAQQLDSTVKDMLKGNMSYGQSDPETDIVKTLAGKAMTYVSQKLNIGDSKMAQIKAMRDARKVNSQKSLYDDFYCQGSSNGAMDPMNIKFRGLGFCSYLKPVDSSVSLSNEMKRQEVEYFLLCRMRMDSAGIDHIANHSKFYMELMKMQFNVRNASLKKYSDANHRQKRLDPDKKKDVLITLNAKIFSSWSSATETVSGDQQLGEFNITIRVDRDRVGADGMFVYDPARDADIVSVTGESFIVPRSSGSTVSGRYWGTGRYRMDLSVSESYKSPEKAKKHMSILGK